MPLALAPLLVLSEAVMPVPLPDPDADAEARVVSTAACSVCVANAGTELCWPFTKKAVPVAAREYVVPPITMLGLPAAIGVLEM